MKNPKKAVRKAKDKAAKAREKAKAKKNVRATNTVARETNVPPEIRRVLLMDELDEMRRIGEETHICVHRSCENLSDDRDRRHCALLSNDIAVNAMEEAEWDLQSPDGFPAFSCMGENIKYHRYGGNIGRGIEPLVFLRDYAAFKPAQLELSEEFRHFHNLYYEESKKEYVQFGESGTCSSVAGITTNDNEARELWIRANEIRQFLAAKQMSLAVYFYVTRFETELTISRIPQKNRKSKIREKNLCYDFRVWHNPSVLPGGALISRLFGKILLAPPPVKEAGIWPFSKGEGEQFPEFKSVELHSGKDVRLSCNPDKIGSRRFLSVVVCRGAVLDKYRREKHFTVGKRGIQCGRQWHLPIIYQDINHVVVHLGDVGRLPEAERLHWAAHNIPHSEWKRAWGNDDQFDFPVVRENANCAWERALGWPLFCPLAKGDEERLSRLHIPTGNSQEDFDQQIISLDILLINYLNTGEMKVNSGHPIDMLEETLQKHDIREGDHWMSFLRHLREIRNGAAHPKEPKYLEHLEALGASPDDLKGGFAKILRKAMDFLRWLRLSSSCF